MHTVPNHFADKVLLLGLDFGSTTSSALVAEARIVTNTVSGQMEFGQIRIVFRSEVVFTPFQQGLIDIARVEQLVDGWLAQSGRRAEDFFSGGVIVTGLAARLENASKLTEIIEKRLGEVLIVAADDPGLESWLAFMGSCAALSRLHADLPIVNLDIGGGTTNPALGQHGTVSATGCYFVGARHVQFEPGGYRVTALTEDAKRLFSSLGIHKGIGGTLSDGEVARLVGWHVQALEAIAAGQEGFFQSLPGCVQQPFILPRLPAPPALTFSGGVGELVYRLSAGQSLPDTTYYGDLGIDLARAIAASPQLSRSLKRVVPENQGRATVYGLTLHSTEVSGITVYLPRADLLPLRHVPIVAQIEESAGVEVWVTAMRRLRQYAGGCCIQILPGEKFDLQSVRSLGGRLAQALREATPAASTPLVLLYGHNAGKTLGSYATEWGKLPVTLIVIDEINVRHASFVNIGKPYKQVVPVAFYGMN